MKDFDDNKMHGTTIKNKKKVKCLKKINGRSKEYGDSKNLFLY
jgi:hypothetical protein